MYQLVTDRRTAIAIRAIALILNFSKLRRKGIYHNLSGVNIRGGSRNFGKGGPVKGYEPSAEGASAGGESGGLPQKILV